MKSAPVVTPQRSPSPQLSLKRSAFGRSKGYHPISSHMSRSPIQATFTSSLLTTTTLLFPALPFDNPTTPLIARRHTHEFPRIFASPTASGSRALLPGRAIKGMVGMQETGKSWRFSPEQAGIRDEGGPEFAKFRTLQRLPWPHQPRQCPQWETPGDSHGRNNSSDSTFDAHSAAQTQLLTLPPLIVASCCTWDKSMVGNE